MGKYLLLIAVLATTPAGASDWTRIFTPAAATPTLPEPSEPDVKPPAMLPGPNDVEPTPKVFRSTPAEPTPAPAVARAWKWMELPAEPGTEVYGYDDAGQFRCLMGTKRPIAKPSPPAKPAAPARVRSADASPAPAAAYYVESTWDVPTFQPRTLAVPTYSQPTYTAPTYAAPSCPNGQCGQPRGLFSFR